MGNKSKASWTYPFPEPIIHFFQGQKWSVWYTVYLNKTYGTPAKNKKIPQIQFFTWSMALWSKSLQRNSEIWSDRYSVISQQMGATKSFQLAAIFCSLLWSFSRKATCCEVTGNHKNIPGSSIGRVDKEIIKTETWIFILG